MDLAWDTPGVEDAPADSKRQLSSLAKDTPTPEMEGNLLTHLIGWEMFSDSSHASHR